LFLTLFSCEFERVSFWFISSSVRHARDRFSRERERVRTCFLLCWWEWLCMKVTREWFYVM
jgi:hypothetical protein